MFNTQNIGQTPPQNQGTEITLMVSRALFTFYRELCRSADVALTPENFVSETFIYLSPQEHVLAAASLAQTSLILFRLQAER